MKDYRIIMFRQGGKIKYRVDKNYPILFFNSWAEWTVWETKSEAQIEVIRLRGLDWTFPETKITVISEISC